MYHPLMFLVFICLFGTLGCDDTSPEGSPDAGVLGHCLYTNAFSNEIECKEYLGSGWDLSAAEVDCQAPLAGRDSSFSAGTACDVSNVLGVCSGSPDDGRGFRLLMTGTDTSLCAAGENACVAFLSGTFEGIGICEGDPMTPPPSVGSAFIQPFEECREPLAGEPEGAGPDGQVCTQNAISGCTEPGRRFDDYASCDVVRSQRPYYPYMVGEVASSDDPRLADEAYMTDMRWLTEEVEACACICCHSSEGAADGASGWDIHQGPLWIDSVSDNALAMLAGFSPSDDFGAYSPEENNGFNRTDVGLPSTDVARLQTFLLAELERRGRDRTWAEAVAPFGGPLVTQANYEPEACADGIGVDAEGQLQWAGGAARYVYVLESGSANPGVPPNRDRPDGTLWRLDVSHTDPGINSGITYGVTPEGATQAWPTEGEPPALEAGREYYLYVLFDIAVPITRCLFTP